MLKQCGTYYAKDHTNHTRKWNPSKSMDWLQTSQDHQVVALDSFGPCILIILGSQAASLTFAECASANSRCSWEKHHEMCPEGLGNNTWRASNASCNFLQLGRWLPVYGVAYMCPWRSLLKGLQHLSWNMAYEREYEDICTWFCQESRRCFYMEGF